MTRALPPLLPVVARWLHAVSLALWLGGLVAIGALVAPTAFHVTRSTTATWIAPAFAHTLTGQNALAGAIVGGSLHLFTYVCYASGLLLLLSNTLLLPRADRRWIIACFSTSAALLATALYLGLSLTPALDTAQRVGDLTTFDRLHHWYEAVSSDVQLPLLLALALFGALRDTPERATTS